jgi:regulatory protein
MSSPDDAASKTYERALGLLAVRARSVRGLEKRLLEKGEPPAHVAAAIARLRAAGLLDDARFAASRARSGILGKSRSRNRMAQTLANDGIARDVAAAAIAQVLEEEGTDEHAVALRAAQKKLRSLAKLDPQARRNKLYGFLARQGYPADVARRVLRAVLDVAPPDEDG